MPTDMQSRRGLTGPTESDDSGNWIYAGHYDPEFKAAVCADLDDLARLDPNWDLFGAPRIRPEVIAAAKQLVNALPEYIAFRPSIVPVPNGTLQLEWHEGPKTLELEFEDGNTIRYLQWNPTLGIEEEDSCASNDLPKAVELIQWFMRGLCV